MRYRALSETGDYQFGQSGVFLVNTPEAVAQAVYTRLHLWSGEWFLDTEEGTPYETRILGAGTQGTRDVAIRERILGTPGVLGLVAYSSTVDGDRKMTMNATVSTVYGNANITAEV